MQKYQLKSASKLIAVSNATKEDLIERIGIKKDKIAVIYEGFDKSLFSPAKPADIKGNSLSYFLAVGTIQPRKNLGRLIKAFSKFEGNDQLWLVGSKGWMSEDIYKLPDKLGIEDKVKFLGYVPDEKLPGLYRRAKALIFPALFEGFGLPILEAQACGCPVITSNLSSMPEVAGKGAIFLNPYSIDDIVKAMERVKGKAERVKLVKAGFENIKRFSWEKCAKDTLKVFEEIGKL